VAMAILVSFSPRAGQAAPGIAYFDTSNSQQHSMLKIRIADDDQDWEQPETIVTQNQIDMKIVYTSYADNTTLALGTAPIKIKGYNEDLYRSNFTPPTAASDSQKAPTTPTDNASTSSPRGPSNFSSSRGGRGGGPRPISSSHTPNEKRSRPKERDDEEYGRGSGSAGFARRQWSLPSSLQLKSPRLHAVPGFSFPQALTAGRRTPNSHSDGSYKQKTAKSAAEDATNERPSFRPMRPDDGATVGTAAKHANDKTLDTGGTRSARGRGGASVEDEVGPLPLPLSKFSPSDPQPDGLSPGHPRPGPPPQPPHEKSNTLWLALSPKLPGTRWKPKQPQLWPLILGIMICTLVSAASAAPKFFHLPCARQ